MINTFNEKDLHHQIKQYLYKPGDQIEVPYKGFIIDIKRNDLLIEIQTKSLGALKKKLNQLLDINRIRIVHPIIETKEIVVLSSDDSVLRKRISPKRGDITDVFEELIYIPELFRHMNLELLLLMVSIQEIRKDDGKGSWRRHGISVINAKLKEVHEEHLLVDGIQLLKYLPDQIIHTEFTTKDLSSTMNIKMNRAQKICYCLSKMEIIEPFSKKGNLLVYRKKQKKSSK